MEDALEEVDYIGQIAVLKSRVAELEKDLDDLFAEHRLKHELMMKYFDEVQRLRRAGLTITATPSP